MEHTASQCKDSNRTNRPTHAGIPLSFSRGALHVFALFSVAVAQPLLDVVSRSPQFFVAHRSQPVDIPLIAVIVCLLPPGLFVLLETVARWMSPALGRGLHAVLVAVLLAAGCLASLKHFLDAPSAVLLVGAVLLGALGTLAYLRLGSIRLFVTYLSLGILLVPGNFLFNSGVTRILLPGEGQTSAVAHVESKVPVVVVIFDELPLTSLLDEQHQIDATRYPSFARLAEDAYWFRNATTVADNTLYAVPAILSGRYPMEGLLPTAQDYPLTLFTLLGSSYEMRVLESGTLLCPDSLCGQNSSSPGLTERFLLPLSDMAVVYGHVLLPADLAAGLPSITDRWGGFVTVPGVADPQSDQGTDSEVDFRELLLSGTWETDRARLFAEYVASIEPSSGPVLYYIHLMLPHLPWQYLPSGTAYASSTAAYQSYLRVDGLQAKEMWVDDEWTVMQAYQRHLLQVAYVDKLLGDLMEKLEESGLYEQSLLVVAGDHGVSFQPGGNRRVLNESNLWEIMSVPLLVKLPNQQQGVVSDRNVETIDVLPTIAEVLGVRIPWQIDGVSALDESQPVREEKIAFTRKFERFTLPATGEHKYDAVERTLATFGPGVGRERLFRFGPYGNLVGTKVTDIPLAGSYEITVHLDGEVLLSNVDPDSGLVPALIKGVAQSTDGVSQELNLAIAVNGTIRAVTRAQPGQNGQAEFSALVPEQSFRPGRNDVTVFVVTGSEEQPVLHATRDRTSLMYTLSVEDGREELTDERGVRYVVVEGGLAGAVDAGELEDGYGVLRGWAADVERLRPAEAVVAFVDGRFLAAGRVGLARRDVASHYSAEELLLAGYEVRFAAEALGEGSEGKVRVFALSGEGVATELAYGPAYPWKPEGR